MAARGQPGETNYLSVKYDGWEKDLMFSDRTGEHPMTADAATGCTVGGSSGLQTANCPMAGITGVRIEGGDRDDELDADPRGLGLTQPLVLDGGPGNDDVEGPTGSEHPVQAFGGDGNDKMSGGDGADVVDGGPGNDTVDGDEGNDTVQGGAGDDIVTGGMIFSADVIDGGPGRDTSNGDWFHTSDPSNWKVSVSLDGVANDGRPEEGDNVTGVEVIHTTRVAALVAGADPVEFAVTNTPNGDSQLIGSPGDDRLRSGQYNDRVEGGAGADQIGTGGGDDTIVGGPGPDAIKSDGGVICDFISCSESLFGNDTIEARDGEKDSIDCGLGTDTAVVDAVDVVANCEHVDVGKASDPGPKGGGACVVPKVKRAAKLVATRKALKRAGCKVAVRKVRSKVRKGRVVGLSRKGGGKVRAGKRLPGGATLVVKVSRGR